MWGNQRPGTNANVSWCLADRQALTCLEPAAILVDDGHDSYGHLEQLAQQLRDLVKPWVARRVEEAKRPQLFETFSFISRQVGGAIRLGGNDNLLHRGDGSIQDSSLGWWILIQCTSTGQCNAPEYLCRACQPRRGAYSQRSPWLKNVSIATPRGRTSPYALTAFAHGDIHRADNADNGRAKSLVHGSLVRASWRGAACVVTTRICRMEKYSQSCYTAYQVAVESTSSKDAMRRVPTATLDR